MHQTCKTKHKTSSNEAVTLHELDDAHWSIIALPWHSAQDASVTSISFSISLRDLFEERVDESLIVDISERLSPGVKRAVLRERDHVIRGLADSLCTGMGGLDATVSDQLGGESAEKGLALVGGLVQLRHALAMTHSFNGRHRRERCDRG